MRVKVTSRGSRASIKLLDVESGELFAECPLPKDAKVATVVEPVIDSSRYFVLRVEDEATRRHAFLGLGFRERDAASDFKLAVQEQQQQRDRERTAAALAEERERAVAAAAAGGGNGGDGGGPPRLHDYSLKGTININVSSKLVGREPHAKRVAGGAAATAATATIAPPPPGAPIPVLAPPPGGFPPHIENRVAGMIRSPTAGAGMGAAPSPASMSVTPPPPPPPPADDAGGGWATFDDPPASNAGGGDDWADFQS